MGKASALAIISVGSGAGFAAVADRLTGRSGSEILESNRETYLLLLGREVTERQLGDSPLHIYDATEGFDPQGLTDLYSYSFPLTDKPIFYDLGQGRNANIRINERGVLKRHDLLIAGRGDT